MGEQPSSARVAIASLGSGASKPAALPRRETPPAAKPAARPQRAHRATSPAVIASPAPVTGFGKIGRARLAQIVDHVELMPGESVEDHAEFSEAIHHDLAPQTPVDLIHVADYLYLRWQLRRVRLWKHELQRGAATAAFVALMKAHLPNLDAAARAKRWRKGHLNSRTRKIMRDAGITSSSVVARALSDHLALFEALEMLDARLDARARDVLRDYERQREARGRRQSNRPLIEGLFRPADNENEEHGDDSAISS
jgi:hypothetical protein